ncbi:16437_t:CDS:1, partial [Funneliformis geosporum]
INPVIKIIINKIKLEYLDFNDNEKLLLRKNLNNFLIETPFELNDSIGAHELAN